MQEQKLNIQSGETEILLHLFETDRIENYRDNENLKREGIYLLMLPLNGKLVGYVGQAKVRKTQEAVLARIREHLRDPFKPDWTHALTISLKNRNLDPGELDYLENRLWEILSTSQSVQIINEREPSAIKEPDNWMELEGILKTLVEQLNLMGIEVFGQICMFHL